MTFQRLGNNRRRTGTQTTKYRVGYNTMGNVFVWWHTYDPWSMGCLGNRRRTKYEKSRTKRVQEDNSRQERRMEKKKKRKWYQKQKNQR